jgi:anti-anti-sigma factor
MNHQLATMQLEQSEGSVVVRLLGEIDLSNAQQIHQQVETAIEGYPRVTVDLTMIDYLDSQGLRLIKQISDKVKGENAELKLVAPPTGVARPVLEMARMTDYVEIRDALEE